VNGYVRILRDPAYARLFSAQVIALLGTGLLTVALGLFAFDIAGGQAGVVLGTALAVKMVAYVLVSPVAAALTAGLPRRPVLIAADLVRAAVALALPWVHEAWHVYVLVFILQSASATFTPAFQALIPAVLTRERDYTLGLSLSRLAYDLEALASPAIAAALLTVMSYDRLFLGTVVGFLASAALVATTRLPPVAAAPPAPFRDRLTAGVRTMAGVPALRGLLALNLAVAAGTAMVIVNTVVIAQSALGRGGADVAVLLAANGAGSMLAAFALPGWLERRSDRAAMLLGGTATALLLVAAGLVLGAPERAGGWPLLMLLWCLLGAANAAMLVPGSRLIRRHVPEEARPGAFAAQFALSHACFLVTYPLAGVFGGRWGLVPAALTAAAVAAVAVLVARAVWPVPDVVPAAGVGGAPRREGVG